MSQPQAVPQVVNVTFIKGKVAAMLKGYRRVLNDKSVPWWYLEQTHSMAISEAKAYLNMPERYTVTERTRKAIENWCGDLSQF